MGTAPSHTQSAQKVSESHHQPVGSSHAIVHRGCSSRHSPEMRGLVVEPPLPDFPPSPGFSLQSLLETVHVIPPSSWSSPLSRQQTEGTGQQETGLSPELLAAALPGRRQMLCLCIWAVVMRTPCGFMQGNQAVQARPAKLSFLFQKRQ